MGIAVGPVSNEVSVVKRVVDTAMGAGAGLYLLSAKVETPHSRRKRPRCFGSTSFISGARDSIRQKRRSHRCRQRNCRLRARNGTLFHRRWNNVRLRSAGRLSRDLHSCFVGRITHMDPRAGSGLSIYFMRQARSSEGRHPRRGSNTSYFNYKRSNISLFRESHLSALSQCSSLGLRQYSQHVPLNKSRDLLGFDELPSRRLPRVSIRQSVCLDRLIH
jgi:hypothetical protein